MRGVALRAIDLTPPSFKFWIRHWALLSIIMVRYCLGRFGESVGNLIPSSTFLMCANQYQKVFYVCSEGWQFGGGV